MSENKFFETKDITEKVILVGIDNPNNDIEIEASLEELDELVKTAGAVTIGKLIQKRDSIHRAHYIGKGKIQELKEYIEELKATGIVCDDELTANQMRNMEQILNTKIMSRTMIILDIFASRASSSEGKLQVELAQLKYNLSHLTGQGKDLSRLGGGIGTRGPGEKKLETDRRNISERITELKRHLSEIEMHRKVLREKRIKNKIPIVALAGYTNAGKSTLMNTITNAGVLAEDKLFATLDTTTRKIELPSGSACLFTDTVGFIQKLPHGLIQAFKATLEELKYCDIIIHVVDSSNVAREKQMSTVYRTFKELECENKPIITIFNKIDKDIEKPFPKDEHAMYTLSVSAKNHIGIDKLLLTVEDVIKSYKTSVKMFIPYNKGNILNSIYGKCEIITIEHQENGTYIEAYCNESEKMILKEYIV